MTTELLSGFCMKFIVITTKLYDMKILNIKFGRVVYAVNLRTCEAEASRFLMSSKPVWSIQ